MLAAIDTAARRICLEVAMNAFFQHHQDRTRFAYRCLDRTLC
jgi:hypothetical protein